MKIVRKFAVPFIIVSIMLASVTGCAQATSVQRIVYPAQSHSGAIFASARDLSQWIRDRFAGVPSIDDCER